MSIYLYFHLLSQELWTAAKNFSTFVQKRQRRYKMALGIYLSMLLYDTFLRVDLNILQVQVAYTIMKGSNVTRI